MLWQRAGGYFGVVLGVSGLCAEETRSAATLAVQFSSLLRKCNSGKERIAYSGQFGQASDVCRGFRIDLG